jgi:ABC-type multidrug transport system fused ATPase/permease subunit
MQKFAHIMMSLLTVVVAIVNRKPTENLLTIITTIITLLVIVNVFVWIIHLVVEKVSLWFEKKRQKNYSLLTWLGETNVALDLYDDLSAVKTFNPEKFFNNYELTKQKIKQRFSTINELKAFKHYLEIKTTSQKYTALFSSTQSILVAIIIPAIITTVNFTATNSKTVLINTVVFYVFWIILLNAIDFIGKELDKIKVLLKLVNECIDDSIGSQGNQ